MVSVVIPTYNCAEYVAEAVESVLRQSYRDFELLVIDDGSEDNTQEVLKPYLDKIRYVRQDNRGAAEAYNAGVASSKGEYVAFLDSDDIWIPEKLERQMDYFKSHPDAGLVCSQVSFIDEHGVDCSRGRQRVYRGYSGRVFYKLLLRNFVPTSSIVVKKECLEKVGEFDPRFKYSQDYDLLLRLARYYRFGFIDSALVKYRYLTTGLTRPFVYEMYKDHIEVIKRMAELFPELNLTKSRLWKRGLSQHYFEFGLEYFTENKLDFARDKFLCSLGFRPYNLQALAYLPFTFFSPFVLDNVRELKRFLRSII